MKHCAIPRQEIGVRTLLNILGPLTNPAGAVVQVIGVYDEGLTELLAKVLVRLGTQHCFLVHGLDGLDEVTLTDRTRISEGKGGKVTSYHVDPSDCGLQRVRLKDLVGGNAQENAHITREILQGRPGAKREIVCLNAAPAFIAGGKAKTWQEGYALAGQVIDSGAAMEKLERLIAFTNKN
jgi:anthranilate phosphoribosyltransferase